MSDEAFAIQVGKRHLSKELKNTHKQYLKNHANNNDSDNDVNYTDFDKNIVIYVLVGDGGEYLLFSNTFGKQKIVKLVAVLQWL